MIKVPLYILNASFQGSEVEEFHCNPLYAVGILQARLCQQPLLQVHRKSKKMKMNKTPGMMILKSLLSLNSWRNFFWVLESILLTVSSGIYHIETEFLFIGGFCGMHFLYCEYLKSAIIWSARKD